MIFDPHDFFYFTTLFTVAIFGGTHLLFSYFRNRLLILNVFLFYLCGLIIGSEFYLQQVNSFDLAKQIYLFHHIVVIIFGTCLWTCLWFYIRPFRAFKTEKLFDSAFLYGLVLPLLLLGLYGFYNDIFYSLSSEKIEGYWHSTTREYATNKGDAILSKIFLFNVSITMNAIVVTLFLVAIIRNKEDRSRLILLLIFRIIVPIIYYTSVTSITEGGSKIPNVGLIILVECIITTWFVSNYRLFNDHLKAATSDLLNSISDLAISTDGNLLVTNSNNLANSCLNIQQGNSIMTVIAAHSSLTFQQIDKKMKGLIQRKNKHYEVSLIDKKEAARIFDLKVSLLKNGEQVEGYTFLMTDLSETRKREKELQSLHETKDRLFAIIGHDLRRPALAFRGISKKVNFLIKKQEFERLNKFGGQIEKLAFSMNNLLDNLLSWALQQRATLPYRPVSVNVNEKVTEVYQLFQQIADEKEIDLVSNVETSCTVFVDSSSFQTIIRNLVDNAIKYTPIGGTVTISSIKQNRGILLRIADTGIGMNQDIIDNIFLLTANKSRRGTEGEIGSGLGLTLVHELILLNKATIKVESHWNEGTTFELFFQVD